MKNKARRFFHYRRVSAVFLVFLSSRLAIGTRGAAGDLDQSFGIQGRRIKTVPNSQPQNGHDFFPADIVIQKHTSKAETSAGTAFKSNTDLVSYIFITSFL